MNYIFQLRLQKGFDSIVIGTDWLHTPNNDGWSEPKIVVASKQTSEFSVKLIVVLP